MHYHCEIIMPPTDNIEAAVAAAMAPFDEKDKDPYKAFWDWYVIGGRWDQEHLRASLGPDKLKAFYEELQDLKVQVRGFQCGKQELADRETERLVDDLWSNTFGLPGPCPLFRHSGNQYENAVDRNVCRLADVPKKLSAARVLFFDGESTFDMLVDEVYNGCRFQKTDWDGNIVEAIRRATEQAKRFREEYARRCTPTSDWICVTVDYHC